MAIAVYSSLLMTMSMPSEAAQHLDSWPYQREHQAAWAHSTVSGTQGASLTPSGQSPLPSIMGVAGNPDSWKTPEFNADWGLGAMNAHYAYARGLTGSGIRLGVFDSGTGLAHSEFSNKDHRSIRIADLLPDGSRCSNTVAVDGPDACFATDGGQVSVTHNTFDSSVPQSEIDRISENIRKRDGGITTYANHGTHVGGTIAANRDGLGMHGVSFGANLTVAKKLNNKVTRHWYENGSTDSSTLSVFDGRSSIIDLYDQMNAQNVRAINHSWGLISEPTNASQLDFWYGYDSNPEDYGAYANGSRAKGMIQVWAAGNSGPNSSPQKSPIAGSYATLPRALPDIEPYWLSVVNVKNDLTLSETSHKCGLSANWCIAAPGTDINSTIYALSSRLSASVSKDVNGNTALTVTRGTPGSGYKLESGTSMAAPHVTGALGLLFERFPYLTNAQVRDVLLTTARDLGAPGVDEIYGWGMV
ncbi:S8 family peptidase, partial [Stenotrophomonas geniculata]|uniref:S8 family peptidase n=1 Tax=Stenotrophomonas geniculata TaxID=86188 RepID=UPI003AADB1FD